MKKNNLFCTFLSTSLSLFSPFVSATPFEGFNVSMGFGGITSDFKIDQVTKLTSPTGSLSNVNDKNVNGSSWIGMIGAGYRYCFTENFILGLEITADLQGARGEINSTVVEPITTGNQAPREIGLSTEAAAKLENSFAILLKPMYLIGPSTAIYGVVGPRWGDFNTSFKSIVAAQTSTGAGAFEIHDHESGFTLGVTAGLGIEHYFYRDLFSVSLEWNYSHFGSIKAPEYIETPIVVGNVNLGELSHQSSDSKAQTNSVLVKITYNFP